ncbi:MAG TPA: hypothetical protein VM778_14490 [Gemmatimonadota bacterium]|nr:hypothetical protein [Gemmatimonadota bacterium]
MPLVPDLFSIAAVSILALAGPVPAYTAPADTVAVYGGRVTGAVLDTPFDVRVMIAFVDDRRFRLVAVILADGDADREVVEGTWRQEGRRVVLRSDDGGDEQVFFVRGDRLVLDTEWPLTALRVFLGLPPPDLHARDGRTL